jgi:hypothetical protein
MTQDKKKKKPTYVSFTTKTGRVVSFKAKCSVKKHKNCTRGKPKMTLPTIIDDDK